MACAPDPVAWRRRANEAADPPGTDDSADAEHVEQAEEADEGTRATEAAEPEHVEEVEEANEESRSSVIAAMRLLAPPDNVSTGKLET